MADAPSRPPERNHVAELDGIRGIAILMVMLAHFGARPAGVPRWFTAPFSMGWAGVDLFFVLSGFLITGILLQTRSSPHYFRSFYARRVLRIFPIYYLAIAIYYKVALPWAHSAGMWQAWGYSGELICWTYLANWSGAFGVEIGPLTHFWSLAIEEQFYLVWPLLIFWLPDRRVPQLCGALIAVSLAARLYGAATGIPGWDLARQTHYRMEPLLWGALSAWWVSRRGPASVLALRRLAAAGALLLGAALLISRSNSPISVPMTTAGLSGLALLSTAAILAAHRWRGEAAGLARWLRSPWLMMFGKYSYGMYILHDPLAHLFNTQVMRWSESVDPGWHIPLWACSKAGGVLLSLLAALVSWHLVEKHFLAWKRHFEA